jgi:hypothetical protein
MSIETTIDEIVEKGNQVNQRLDGKIKALEQHNNAFRTTLINKLQIINGAIDNFKKTNLQGLTDTKNELDDARRQLQETQLELTRTQGELDDVRRQYTDINNRLTATNEDKKNLEDKIVQLETIIKNMETDCNNRISSARKEMADKSTQEKKQMVQEQEEIKRESDAQIAKLTADLEDLRRQSEEARRGQETANNELRTLQENQERLLVKLGTVNQILASQLEMIDKNIDLNNPNYGDYESLLDTIQAGLGGVISGINSAVSGTTGTSTSSSSRPYNAEENYQRLKNMPSNVLGQQINELLGNGSINRSEKNLIEMIRSPQNKTEIINILNSKKLIIPDPNISGGKRKRKHKTMKKRRRRTRKHMKKHQKGGYTYGVSKDLDKASSEISNTSTSSKMSNYSLKSPKTFKSNSNRNKKSRRRSRHQSSK